MGRSRVAAAAGLARSLSLQRANARAKSCSVIRAGIDYQSCAGRGGGASPHDLQIQELSRRNIAVDLFTASCMPSSAGAPDQCMIGACIDNDDDDDTGIRAGIDQYLPSKEADHLQQQQAQAAQLVDDGGSSNICSFNGTTSESWRLRPFMVVNDDDDDGSCLNAIKTSLSADISTSAADYKACFSSVLGERIDRASDLWDGEFSSMSRRRCSYYAAADQDPGRSLSGLQRRLNNGRSFFSDAAASKGRGDHDDACSSTSSSWSELEESLGTDAASSELEETIRVAAALDQLPANSVAVEKVSVNPVEDFRESMFEMMMEKEYMEEEECGDMEDLLHCYLLLNPSELHDVITEVFSHVWIDVIMAIR